MIFIMVMNSLSKTNNTTLLQQELQNPYWCLHDPIATKSYQISSEMDIDYASCNAFFWQQRDHY